MRRLPRVRLRRSSDTYPVRGVALAFLGVALALPLLGAAAGSTAVAAITPAPFGPAYVAVPGSPVGVGATLDGIAVNAVGKLVAAVDPAGNVYTLSIDPATGALTPVSGSPFASGGEPVSVAFNPAGNLLATADLSNDTVSVFSVSAAGGLAPVPGSPFPTGQAPRAVAFSPAGNLLAVANQFDDTVSVFDVGGGGTLNPVPGSPFTTGAAPVALSFNPSGSLLAVANENDNTVSIFSVSGGGALTPSGGSPIAAGDGPQSVAFSPSGNLLAVANSSASTVSMFTTGPAAAEFSIVPGSPFATGAVPLSVAFNSAGNVLATADSLDGTTAIFNVSATGSLALAAGAPFAGGSGPHSVAFVPGSSLVATANTDGTVSLLEPVPPPPPILPPVPTIVAPTANESFTLGQAVQTRFYCLDSPLGPGIASCTDGAGGKSPFGVLNTKTLGNHTYSITAVSADGQSAATSVTYTVTQAPPAATTPPKLSGKDAIGQTLRCSRGTWSGGANRFTYRWLRNGIPLAGATHPSHRIEALDAGSLLGCTVKGSVRGLSASAISNTVTIPVRPTKNCPAATGKLTPTSLGALTLGDTAKQARRAMKGSKQSRTAGHTQFCLSPDKIEIGFPTAALRRLLRGKPGPTHAVWILTGNPHYTYSNVGIGMSLKDAKRLLNPGVVEQSKRLSIYLAPQPTSTIVMVANRKGVIEQIGIADNRATANSKLMLALAGSITGSVAVAAPK